MEPSSPAMADGDRASLYRAYRPLTFAEIVGEPHVTQTLRNAVRYGKVAHAYLFTGPRGTGKTSTARILARAVNCQQPHDGEPCNRCSICVSMLQRRSLDLVEIDGASNNSVDDVRELRERVNLRPAEGRQKVFIIDEVHMLSIGAFNALLKTLEEPPDHVLFALATTELQKVPATVRSRCQLLELRPIPPLQMLQRLRFVCAKEGISADDDVLRFITAQSTGSARDALSLLEQIRAFCGDTLLLAEAEAALGVARVTQVASLAGAMARGDVPAALALSGDLIDSGVEPRQLGRQLIAFWRDALVGRARRKPSEEPHVARCRADQVVQVLYSLMGFESSTRRSDSPRWALETAIADAALHLDTSGNAGVSESAGLSAVVRRAESALDSLDEGAHPTATGTPAGAPAPAASGTAGVPPGPVDDAGRDTRATRVSASSVNPSSANPSALPSDNALAATERIDREDPLEHRPQQPEPAPAIDAGTMAPAASRDEEREAQTVQEADIRERWHLVARRLHDDRKQLVYMMLQKVVVEHIAVENRVVMLPFRPGDAFNRQQLDTPANRKVLEDTLGAVLGGHWVVRCVTIDTQANTPRLDLSDLDYLEQMAAEAAALGAEREPGA